MDTSPIDEKWTIVNPPPEGHKDVGTWAWQLFDTARRERDRLQLPERWLANYTLYRGDHWQVAKGKKNKSKVTLNLFFANVERTKANITARNPLAEVVDLDGKKDDAEGALTARIKQWWKDTNQKTKLATSALKMEKYGITIEKACFDTNKGQAEIVVTDCYAFFPAPGNWEDIATDPPYVCFAYPENVSAIERMFKIKGVQADDVYSLFGEQREDKRPVPGGPMEDAVRYDGTVNKVTQKALVSTELRESRALVVEIWVRDYSTEKVTEDVEVGIDESTGEPIIEAQETGEERAKYPGNIRVITLTKSGQKGNEDATGGPVVLADKPNPNINPNLPEEAARESYLFDRFPFYKVNSYEDTTNIWGFSAAEQVGDLNRRIDEIFSRLAAWVNRAMFPPLIIPNNCGITKEMINNKPNLVLFPTNPQAAALIRFEAVPNLPANFFQILDLFLRFFDRIYQIEDADRGVGPKGVVAASAIVALQERNAVLIQHKIEMMDYIVEQRGKCFISLYQNFGASLETVNVEGEKKEILGTALAGRKFSYLVESGSTVPKTSLQIAAQSEKYYELGAIDRQALLENTNYPGWKQIIERVGEGQLNQALQILIAAGLPEEDALVLRDFLMESQGGPGNRSQEATVGRERTTPGKPKSLQGEKPPLSVAAPGEST